MKNPFLIFLAFFLVKNAPQIHIMRLSPLQIESALDNVHDLLHMIEKVNGLSAGGLASLPDMKKMLEVVEKIPL